MLIINNRFLSLYDYNFLLVIEKIFSVNSKICGSKILHLRAAINNRNILREAAVYKDFYLLRVAHLQTQDFSKEISWNYLVFLTFGILFIWKFHQIHFVFLLIVLGYQSLLLYYLYLYFRIFSILILYVLAFQFSSLLLQFSLVIIFGVEIY